MNSELRDILFLDIETVRGVPVYSMLSERLKVQWARKASFFKREDEKTDADLYIEKAGIYAEFGQVIVISVGKYVELENGEVGFKTRTLSGEDEKKVLQDFKIMLEKMDPSTTRLCAHNGKEFDFPYLCRRMVINRLEIPGILNTAGKKPWEVSHLDTMELWKFGDFKNFTSLALLTRALGIPSPKDDIDGSMVGDIYWGTDREAGIKRITEYCQKDVVAAAQVYLRIHGEEPIDPSNIEIKP